MEYETTFENAKVGDKVWDFVEGYGNIIYVNSDMVRVAFDNAGPYWYSLKGLMAECKERTLFWSKIKFKIPKRVKRC